MLQVRREGVRVHAGLEGHGSLLRHSGHPRAGTQPHHHRLHLHLHIHHDEETAQRRPHPRQGVRDRALGEPVEPEPHDELRADPHLLAVVAAVHLRAHVRALDRTQVHRAQHPLHGVLAGRPQLGLEGRRPAGPQSSVQAHVAHPVSDGVLQTERTAGGRTDRDGRGRLRGHRAPALSCRRP